MIFENPFRWSKFQLTWRVLLLIGMGIVATQAGCGDIFGTAFFLLAGLFGSLLAAKVYRDMNAASAHTRYTPLDSSSAPPPIGQTTHSAESSKLELFGPPSDF